MKSVKRWVKVVVPVASPSATAGSIDPEEEEEEEYNPLDYIWFTKFETVRF
jgi:hypothetical protein